MRPRLFRKTAITEKEVCQMLDIQIQKGLRGEPLRSTEDDQC